MTERKSTGASPLLDMIMEIYDTKARMKAVINRVIETKSDDFEEYATLSHNFMSIRHNKGVEDGYNDGWHQIFPGDQLDPSVYDIYYWRIIEFTPSIPEYSTGEDIDNLVVVMRDNLRCRELLKAALLTQSDEFVTYPDILEAYYDSVYQDAYDFYYDVAYNAAIESAYKQPTIKQHKHKIEIINNADFGTVYYWTGNQTIEDKQLYTGQFELNTRQMVYAVLYHDGKYSPISSWLFVVPEEEEFTWVITEDMPQYRQGNNDYYYIPIPGNSEQTIEFSINDGVWRTPDYLISGSTLEPIHDPVIYIYIGQRARSFNVISPNAQTYELHKGDRIKFRGNNTRWQKVDCTFGYDVGNNDHYVKRMSNMWLGNFLSVFTTDFRNTFDLNDIPNNPQYPSGFGRPLFYDDSAISGYLELENTALTAITLIPYCYQGIFWRAKSYPDLPATNLAEGCYYWMFDNNTYITTAPELPATTLAASCYQHMFRGCTNLTTAPDLPATTLVSGCYDGMFWKCTSLNSIKCLATDISAGGTQSWVYNVASTGTFVKAAGVTWPTGQSGIPSGWTVQDAA